MKTLKAAKKPKKRTPKPKAKSKYPSVLEAAKVGKYDAYAHSGAGYFYDEVLEYRVWLHPEAGAPDKFDGDDYFHAFERCEDALAFSKKTPGAEAPLALVLQKQHINEPSPGVFEHIKKKRIAEWSIEWLDSKRQPDSIKKFLAAKGRKSK